MAGLLDWIRVDETFTLLVLIALLIFAGQQMTSPSAQTLRQARHVGGAVIVVYGVLSLFTWPPASAGELLDTVIRSLLAGGIALGTGLIVFAVVHNTVGNPLTAFADWWRRQKAAAENRAEQLRLRREQQNQERRQREEWERTQPERERQQRAAEQRQARMVREASVREQLRFEVQLFYDRHRAELRDVFPAEVFQAYLDGFLGDNVPQNLCEKRAEQLKDMIRDRLQLEQKHEQVDFQTVEDVLQHFANRKQRIRELQLDDPDADDVKETMLTTIDAAQDRAIREFLT